MNKNLLKPYKEKSKLLGINHQYLMQIANGYRQPSAEVAIAMFEKLGIPLWESRPDYYPRRLFQHFQHSEAAEQ